MTRLSVALAAATLAAGPALTQEAAPAATAAMIGPAGEALGTLELIPTPVGVLIRGELSGLPPGTHGFHIHETGACEPPFDSAGGHFNPTGAPHGFFAEGGPHAGDMPNVTVPDSGALAVEVLNGFTTLDGGILDADGSALVIHADPDDYAGQPSGHAGDRLACGVVTGS